MTSQYVTANLQALTAFFNPPEMMAHASITSAGGRQGRRPFPRGLLERTRTEGVLQVLKARHIRILL